MGEKKSGIRELFEYGLRQAAVVGKENVYDYSLGNPSVPAPEEVASIIRELLEGDSLALHGYTPAGGAKEAQQAVADDLTQRSGDTIRPENIFFTCGAAPALVAGGWMRRTARPPLYRLIWLVFHLTTNIKKL